MVPQKIPILTAAYELELAEDDLETTFAHMERAEQLDKQLAELKARRGGSRALTS